jgi:hypothetical protein
VETRDQGELAGHENFSMDFAVMSPYNTDKYAGNGGSTANGLANDDFAGATFPTSTEFNYKTDACGKIGHGCSRVLAASWTGEAD